MQEWFFDFALLPDGWAQAVGMSVADGVIERVSTNVSVAGRQHLRGVAIPGLPNVHSHSFQRAMAGLAEIRGPDPNTFWSWRRLMYQFVNRLTPDDLEAIAAFAFAEMLESGFTAVGEFHYLHNDPEGHPYADRAELCLRIAEAARTSGIGLTLLPVFYANDGFGGRAPLDGQKRFISDPTTFAELFDGALRAAADLPDTVVGVAPHSLRAVTPESLAEVVALASTGPIHMHIAEQNREVEECIAWSGGRTPVKWLLDEFDVDERWCLVHATHTSQSELGAISRHGVVVGLCPLTEANLGDGIFAGDRFAAAGGRFAVGSDSNIEISAAAELKQLEYSQRLQLQARNVLAQRSGQSTGRRLYEAALSGGRQALGRRLGALAVGQRADIVVLDVDHPDFCATDGDGWLDVYIFVSGLRAIDAVIVGGKQIVSDGRHADSDAIRRRYTRVAKRLTATRS